MQHRVLVSSFVAFAMSGALVLACGDDDSSANGTPDGGTQSPDAGGTSQTDSGAPSDDASSDADAQASARAPVTPMSTTRLANAINPYGLLYASDGFLYVSGATMDGADRKLAVWRFKDGALDTTFGMQGILTTDIPGDESSFDIVELSAGTFVVQAVAGGKIYLVKLRNGIGGGSSFETPVFVKLGYDQGEGWPAGTPNAPAAPPSYQSWGIGVDRSDAAAPKIVVFASGAPAKAANSADQRTDNDRWITRVMADTLAFDTTFNGGVPFSADADGKKLADNARRGIVLADGSIVSAGYTSFGQNAQHVVLIRLLATGAADPAFGFGTTTPIAGQTKINPFSNENGTAEAYGITRQASGRYITTGYGVSNAAVTKAVDLVSLGVTAEGALDTSYGEQGALAWLSEKDKSAGLGAAPFTDRGRDVAVLADGRIVQVGSYDDYASVFVFDENGTPDRSSGTNGLVEYAYPAGFFKVAVSPDAKHIAATAQSLNQTADAGAPLGSVLAILAVGQ